MDKTKLHYYYLNYSLSVMVFCTFAYMFDVLMAWPSGRIILNFNRFGEYIPELILLISAIPGVLQLWKSLLKQLAYFKQGVPL